jgi:ribokinase
MSVGTVAVVGSVNQDLHLRLDALPLPGETVLARRLARGPGGKGANQAVAVARHGGASQLIGAVGRDFTGDSLLRLLKDAGVGVEHVRAVPGTQTGTAVVMVDDHGENAIVVASEANMALDPEHVRLSLQSIGDIAVVLTQAEVSMECIAAAAEFAAATQARFILNLAPYTAISTELLRSCDPLIVNEIEAAALSEALGIPHPAGGDADPVLATELAKHCLSVIVTLGAHGAFYSDGNHSGHVPAPKVKVVDTTGAGDAFVGAVAAHLADHHDLVASCSAGIEAGAYAVQHEGAQP